VNVRAGEMLAVVGPSGSGKSTLLYCLSSLEEATSGHVSIAGVPIGGLSRHDLARLRRDRIGFVFQQFNLIPSLTAWENVALPARLAKRSDVATRVERALAQVGLEKVARQRPAELSGGQQQRVALARVLANEPEIVFADEPTGALDTESSERVLDLPRTAAHEGTAVVMVTHDLDAAARADRVLVLRDGALVHEFERPTASELLVAMRTSASDEGRPAA
jgi:putative ABC transport system ATP-binding protein